MKKLSIIALLATFGFSGNLTIMPYGAYTSYSSIKDKSYLEGIYGSFYSKPIKLELDVENLLIRYKDSTPNWKQQDATLIGHYYIGNNYDVKIGVHEMFVDDGTSKYSQPAYILGLLYYKYLQYNFGADYYYTSYDAGFNVNQLTLRGGINFGDYNSYDGSFYLEGKLNFIRISEDVAPKKNYSNVDLKLQNFKGPWTTTLNASIGKYAYKVGNDGFVVYNTADEYKYNAGIKINYKFTKVDNMTLGFSRSKYNDNSNSVYANSYFISYAHSF